MTAGARSNWRGWALGVASVVVVSFLSVTPPGRPLANTASPGAQTGSGGGPVQSGSSSISSGTQAAGAKQGTNARTGTIASNSRFECKAGRNGGKTGPGVFPDRIRLAATNVRSGVGSSFLGSSWVGMEAVVNRVNATGGICGRLLELTLRDDGWDASRGAAFIENFINDPTGYLALPVVPSSEGLTQAIRSGAIGKASIPVIGTDGMLKEQYSDPLVYPVATATVSTMRVMAKHAYDKGARSFGIVYDQQYKFGREGASAFKTYVATLSGANLKAYVGITPLRPSYKGEAEKFDSECGKQRCDFVAMLLEPGTANTWIASHGDDAAGRRLGFGRLETSGAQPLFNETFARGCGSPCDGMTMWTGYNPAVGPLKSVKGIARYIADVQAISPRVDITNQFMQGAYLGMQVFVEALRQVGPNVTRARLPAIMSSMSYRSDLSSSLTWRNDQHFANLGAQAFEIVTSAGSFAGFRNAGTGFIKDPTPGVVPRD